MGIFICCGEAAGAGEQEVAVVTGLEKQSTQSWLMNEEMWNHSSYMRFLVTENELMFKVR